MATLVVIAAAVLSGCWGDDDESGQSNRGGSINVAIVDNPQMQDLARLTPSLFTKKSHIKVNYTILDHGTLRDIHPTRDIRGFYGYLFAYQTLTSSASIRGYAQYLVGTARRWR
jgi:hypothetical protein